MHLLQHLRPLFTPARMRGYFMSLCDFKGYKQIRCEKENENFVALPAGQ